MKTRWLRFNINLLLLLAVVPATGCLSTEGKLKRLVATLRLYVETNQDAGDRSTTVPVYRARPVNVTIEKNPFLTEVLLEGARVQENMGSYEIRVEFERRGAWLLEQYTGDHRGKHLAVFSQWMEAPGSKLNDGRWLAAPLIHAKISDGVLVFTPDASREEADLIVLGLNNVIRKVKKGAI